MTLRLFLDANVLFSAAYRADSGLRVLWQMKNVQLVTSAYAIEEARRNLNEPQHRADLEALSQSLQVTTELPTLAHSANNHGLPDKDVPILMAAITAKADFLLTGDKQHFGHLFGKRIQGIHIVTPRMFMELHPNLVRK